MERDLLILVPALSRFAQGEQRKRLIDGLVKTSEVPLVRRSEERDRPSAVVPLRVSEGGRERGLDVREAYWNDLVPSLSTAGVRTRVVRGLSLLTYWVFSGVWKGFLGRKYLTLGLSASVIALIFWYYGVLALFLDAVLADPKTAPFTARLATGLHEVLLFIGSWEVWLIASLVMGFIPVTALVEMLDFTKRYLANERTEGEGVGLHIEIRDRIRNQILEALEAADYDRLILVSHSFGTMVAIDVFADIPLPEGLPVRMVTLGSPAELLARKDPTVLEEVRKCCGRPQLADWLDLHAENDWFATGVPLPEGGHCRAERVPVKGTFVDALSGRTHDRYFDQEQTAVAVLGP